MTASLDRHISISEDAVFREIDGEAVILDLNAGMYFGLDPVGTRLWQLIDAHGALRPAYEAALQEFDVDAATLERDLLELVELLQQKHLVVLK